MKKILAIALAVVMVLSMASAFAFNFNFACDPATAKLGEATLEVVPYVKVNTGCGDFDWVQSTCAAAVSTENIFFLLKVTVPKDINPIWWKYLQKDGAGEEQLTVSVDSKGLSVATNSTASIKLDLPKALVDGAGNLSKTFVDDSSDGWVFYAKPAAAVTANGPAYTGVFTSLITDGFATGDWYEATEGTDPITNNMFGLKVTDARKAKVTAKMTSNFDGYDEWLTFGSYKVLAKKLASYTDLFFIDSCVATPDVSDADATVAAANFPAGTQIFNLSADAVTGKVNYAASNASTCTAGFENAVMSYFSINFGSCFTDSVIKSNFGWKDTVNAPWTWSGNATAIVDVQCEVEIPKTGDVSVIAYAVMAVVAAAGAMGLKK